MNFSITGFAYLILSFTIGFFIYRIFQYWRKEKDTISKLLFYISLIFWLFVFIKAIGGLFFAQNLTFLRFTIFSGVFLQAFAFSLMSYFFVYVKFSSKISPWWGFIPVFILGMIATYFTIFSQFHPFLESSGAINWGVPPGSLHLNILQIFLFLIAFIPAIFILSEQFKQAQDIYTKRKTFGLICFFSLAIIAALFDFIFINIFKLDAIWRDIVLIFSGLVLIVILVLTRKSVSFEKQ